MEKIIQFLINQILSLLTPELIINLFGDVKEELGSWAVKNTDKFLDIVENAIPSVRGICKMIRLAVNIPDNDPDFGEYTLEKDLPEIFKTKYRDQNVYRVSKEGRTTVPELKLGARPGFDETHYFEYIGLDDNYFYFVANKK